MERPNPRYQVGTARAASQYHAGEKPFMMTQAPGRPGKRELLPRCSVIIHDDPSAGGREDLLKAAELAGEGERERELRVERK